MSKRALAKLVSDLHLSAKKPPCRGEEDWWAVQERYLSQLGEGGLPVICAGDVFDKWNASNETVSFAIRHLPQPFYSVPGQHDLPQHNKELMRKSAYGVLVEAEVIKDISGTAEVGPTRIETRGPFINAYGFGWEEPFIQPGVEKDIKLAVVHQYCWTKNNSYPDAPADCMASHLIDQLEGFECAVFGDNHKGFLHKSEGIYLLNNGGFIRRKSDEIEYKPGYGILWSDGSISREYFDTSEDVFDLDMTEKEECEVDMKAFIEELKNMGEKGLDFIEFVKTQIKKEDYPKPVQQKILKYLEDE